MMPSLDMLVERSDAGTYWIDAPWLEVPVDGASFEEAYEKAIRARR